jgi:hypothetical protein
VSWYDVVKWCNARSQRDGLTPVYYTDAGFTTVYKTGELNTVSANWAANGYQMARLFLMAPIRSDRFQPAVR